MKRTISLMIVVIMFITVFAVIPSVDRSEAATTNKWTKLQAKYAKDPNVKQLVFVKYNGRKKTKLFLYTKTKKNKWKRVLSCKAYVGQYGLDKKKEGDRRTPTGQFNLEKPFGNLKDPGSRMPYTKVNKYLYWCGDKDHYNQLIDIRKIPHKCRGERLADYPKQYAYAMNISYNSGGVYPKGSAIFLHCFGNYNYTLGCVSISKKNMKKVIKKCGYGTKICIYRK